MIDFVWDLPHWGYVEIWIVGTCKLYGNMGCELSENLSPFLTVENQMKK